jgi:hypothetical protein
MKPLNIFIKGLAQLIFIFGSTLCIAQTPDDNQAPRNEVERMMNELKVRSGLSGRAHANSIDFLTHQIRQTYGYSVSCDRSILGGISDWDCLIGLRKFLSTLEDSAISHNPEILGVSALTIAGSKNWKATNAEAGNLNISIPFNARTDDVARYLQYYLQNPRRLSQRQLLTSLEQRIKDEQKNLKFAIEVDPTLSPDKVNRGLTLLEQTVPGLGPQSDEAGIEVIALGASNTAVSESHQKLRVGLNVDSSVAAATDFLREQILLTQPSSYNAVKNDPAKLQKWIELGEFRKEREQLTQLANNVSKALGDSPLYCGETDDVPVSNCLRGVEALNTAITMLPDSFRKPFQEVTIKWSTVSTTSADVTTDDEGRRVLEVQSSATPSDIASAFTSWE